MKAAACLVASSILSALFGGDLRFSDPDLGPRPPEGAIGYPSRQPDLDVRAGFLKPPPGYSEVAFYWWLGDPLTRERISWQLERLKGAGISGLQVNYAHSDAGGISYGLTYASEPPLFSKPWWDLFGWFVREAGRRGMAASLSDYTLGLAGQGWYIDEILKENPDLCGSELQTVTHQRTGPGNLTVRLPEVPLSVMAFRVGKQGLVPGSGVDIRDDVYGRTIRWPVPAGDWQVAAVVPVRLPASLDPMNPLSGPKVIEKFYQRFEDGNPGESGKGLNFFFSDELQFGVKGYLWNNAFAAEFRKRKGYDVVPEIAALFMDIGPRTPKVRLDYSDVMVALEEEGYFRPIYEWHTRRGMMFGCDHGGRGREVAEFGDYFRTQRWMSAPGNDQPGLSSDVIKNKVSSSMAHLYKRPRTWLEGYYGSGWGTTTAALTDATYRNFIAGHNLLGLHGLYYSTHGGWWEWAPPCNHFRMPYWAHMDVYLRMVERLSYLLSQGVHRADVAIVYPVAAMEAGMGGKESVQTAFALGTDLFHRGIDFDFIDFESLARAQVEGGELRVSGEAYRVLVLPAMRALRFSTIEKAREFARAGGVVINVGPLPEASDRAGREDPRLSRIVHETFLSASAKGIHTANVEEARPAIDRSLRRDLACVVGPGASHPQVLHRRIGPREVYMVYRASKGMECAFRATGRAELWDPWSGRTLALPVVSQNGEGTRLRMPLGETEAQLIVFTPGSPAMPAPPPARAARRIPIQGPWEFELKPTMDNRWGDYRLPASNALIGAEVRRFRYAEESSPDQGPLSDDSRYRTVTCSFGPRFWKLGPLPDSADLGEVERQLAALGRVDPASPVVIAGGRYPWRPYEFSLRWGVEGDPGHQGYHGLKGLLTDDFIALGKPRTTYTSTVYEKEEAGGRYFLWTSVRAECATGARILSGGRTPGRVWLNGVLIGDASEVRLQAGANPLLLRYDGPGRGHLALLAAGAPSQWKQDYPLAMTWFNRPGLLPFDPCPENPRPVGWYRFDSPPGLRAMKIVALGTVQAWADGRPAELAAQRERPGGAREYEAVLERPARGTVKVAIRLQQERGAYGGAALPEPVSLDCQAGEIELGDWSRIDGLAAYSGGAWYRKALKLEWESPPGSVFLDLGEVAASAEVHVNGHPAGVKVAPPWRWDVTRLVRKGQNKLEVLVFNTLANHYLTIPTRYRGRPVSGILGPAALELTEPAAPSR